METPNKTPQRRNILTIKRMPPEVALSSRKAIGSIEDKEELLSGKKRSSESVEGILPKSTRKRTEEENITGQNPLPKAQQRVRIQEKREQKIRNDFSSAVKECQQTAITPEEERRGKIKTRTPFSAKAGNEFTSSDSPYDAIEVLANSSQSSPIPTQSTRPEFLSPLLTRRERSGTFAENVIAEKAKNELAK